MNLPDSSLWIEYLLGNDIASSVKSVIKDVGSLCVPSICLYEVYKKFLSTDGVSRADAALDIMQKANVVLLTPNIAVQAALVGKRFGLPTADSIIYATAQVHNAEIYTQDKHFEGLDGVHYFAKR